MTTPYRSPDPLTAARHDLATAVYERDEARAIAGQWKSRAELHEARAIAAEARARELETALADLRAHCTDNIEALAALARLLAR